MGRIKRRLAIRHKSPKLSRRTVLGWTGPAVVAGVVLFGVYATVKADPAPSSTQLSEYLKTNELFPGTSAVGGYDQVYYIYNNNYFFLTKEAYNHLSANGSGEYITWEGLFNGGRQIFLYDLLTDTETQITTVGTNENPVVYRNTVVWQAWDGEHWQIMYYDGSQVRQITSSADYSSVYGSSNGSTIIYATEVTPNDWKAQQYDIATGQTTTIREGDQPSTAYPHYNSDGSVSTAYVPQ